MAKRRNSKAAPIAAPEAEAKADATAEATAEVKEASKAEAKEAAKEVTEFEVKCLYLSTANKIFKSKDVVTETDLKGSPQKVETLLKNGSIEEIKK